MLLQDWSSDGAHVVVYGEWRILTVWFSSQAHLTHANVVLKERFLLAWRHAQDKLEAAAAVQGNSQDGRTF